MTATYNEATKQTNHAALRAYCHALSLDACRHVMKDCKQVLAIGLPDNPKNGHYQDTIHYCAERDRMLQGG